MPGAGHQHQEPRGCAASPGPFLLDTFVVLVLSPLPVDATKVRVAGVRRAALCLRRGTESKRVRKRCQEDQFRDAVAPTAGGTGHGGATRLNQFPTPAVPARPIRISRIEVRQK